MSRAGAKINWCFTDFCEPRVHETFPGIAPDEVRYLVAQKEVCPETGREHWQGYVQLNVRQRLSTVSKLLPGAHWEPAKGTPDQNFAYCTKTESRKPGTEPVIYGVLVKQGQKRKEQSIGRELVKRIKSGATLADIWEDDTVNSYLLLHAKQVEFCIALNSIVAMPIPPSFSFERFNVHSECRWISEISQWLLENLDRRDRPLRSLQLWIHSDVGGVGKTTLLSALSKYFKTYIFPYDDDWVEGYDNSYELVIMDEYSGNATIGFMKSFVDGSHVKLRRRGQAPYLKTVNVPVIVCSNKSIREVYHKASEVDVSTLIDRFYQVYVDRLDDPTTQHLANVILPEV